VRSYVSTVSLTRRRVAVVGAGVAGLAAAHALIREAPELDVVVLERAGRAGGLVETERTPDGFVVEHGADCLVTTKPWGIAAVQALGLLDQVVTGPEPRRSFVVADGTLVAVPGIFAGPTAAAVVSLLRTPLLSMGGKARLAMEPFLPRRRDDADESVSAFLDRRFGREVSNTILEPLLGGIYGGHAERLSADACIPRLRDFEREHRSVTLGMRRAVRARRRQSAGARLPVMVSLRDGMGSLLARFAAAIGARLRCGIAVDRIERIAAGRLRLATAAGPVDCDGVVVAVPAWRAPSLLERLDPDLAAALAAVRHQALDCVTMAWAECDVPRRLDGSGFVTPATDGRPTRACTWSSHKWPGRAPTGQVLVRSVLHRPDARADEVLDAARGDLRELMGITAPPALVRVRRLPRATPIYEVGALAAVAAMQARARALGAVALAGNAHGGIGIPDCVRSGESAARAVLGALAGRQENSAPV
jgi:protoporphyrinogen/coproporphyrinogen III oxidase